MVVINPRRSGNARLRYSSYFSDDPVAALAAALDGLRQLDSYGTYQPRFYELYNRAAGTLAPGVGEPFGQGPHQRAPASVQKPLQLVARKTEVGAAAIGSSVTAGCDGIPKRRNSARPQAWSSLERAAGSNCLSTASRKFTTQLWILVGVRPASASGSHHDPDPWLERPRERAKPS